MAQEKILRWKYNPENQTIAAADYPEKYEKVAEFSFQLIRYKDTDTYEETLVIKSLLKGNPNGEIISSIDGLDKDIARLRQYGVALSPIQMTDLKREIENNYLNLPALPDNTFPLDEAVEIIKEYIAEQEEPSFDIPASEFNKLFEEDEIFSHYNVNQVKKRLANKGLIEKGTSGGRTTIVVRKGDKPIRVVRLCKAKFEV